MRGKEVGRVSIIKFLKACLRRQGRKNRRQQLKGDMVLGNGRHKSIFKCV